MRCVWRGHSIPWRAERRRWRRVRWVLHHGAQLLLRHHILLALGEVSFCLQVDVLRLLA